MFDLLQFSVYCPLATCFSSLSTVNRQLSTLLDTRIPPIAWLFIAILVIFTLAVNIAMIALLRAKTPPGKAKRQPQAGGLIGAAQNLAKMSEVMRDPFAKDRDQLDELSRLVSGLEKPSAPNAPGSPANTQDAKRNAE